MSQNQDHKIAHIPGTIMTLSKCKFRSLMAISPTMSMHQIDCNVIVNVSQLRIHLAPKLVQISPEYSVQIWGSGFHFPFWGLIWVQVWSLFWIPFLGTVLGPYNTNKIKGPRFNLQKTHSQVSRMGKSNSMLAVSQKGYAHASRVLVG